MDDQSRVTQSNPATPTLVRPLRHHFVNLAREALRPFVSGWRPGYFSAMRPHAIEIAVHHSLWFAVAIAAGVFKLWLTAGERWPLWPQHVGFHYRCAHTADELFTLGIVIALARIAWLLNRRGR